jgi:ketosteroid isomerase-like protein
MTHQTRLGDEVPKALAAYFEALDGNRFADAVAAFSPDAVYAVPPSDAIETDPRSIARGRDELQLRFAGRAPTRLMHDLLLCAVEADGTLVEGITRERASGDARSSFAASVQFDGSGLVARYLAFATAEVITPLPADANPSPATPGSAIDKIHEYFHALDEHRFDDAAACFSTETVYSHPPYKDPTVGGAGRAAFVGRDELLAAFLRRGRLPIDHRIVLHAQRGPHLLFEGVVNDDTGSLLGSFVSEATLDDGGLIRRYASWYTQPGVPRR